MQGDWDILSLHCKLKNNMQKKMNNDKVNFAYYMHCSLHNLSCKHKCLHDCFFRSEHLLYTLDRVDLHIVVHLFHMQGDQDNGSLLCILKYRMWQNDKQNLLNQPSLLIN